MNDIFNFELVSVPIVAKTKKLSGEWKVKIKNWTHIRRTLQEGTEIELGTIGGPAVFTVMEIKDGWAHCRSKGLCADLKRVGKKCWRYNHNCYGISAKETLQSLYKGELHRNKTDNPV